MPRFRRMRTLQKFASVHASVHNQFDQERSLSSRAIFKLNRAAALAEWRGRLAAEQIPIADNLRRVRIRLTAPHSAVSERLSMAQGLTQTGPFLRVGNSADAGPGPPRKHPFSGMALRDRSEILKVILPHRSPARARS